MPPLPHQDPDSPNETEEHESFDPKNINQWLERLRRNDRFLYNLMALEVWSIARTMDGLIPGFWSRFMENRQIALKQFVQRKHSTTTEAPQPEHSNLVDEETDSTDQ